MATRKPPPEETPDPPPEAPPKRSRRPRHSADNPLQWEITGAGTVRTTYTIANAARADGPADDLPVRHVRN